MVRIRKRISKANHYVHVERWVVDWAFISFGHHSFGSDKGGGVSGGVDCPMDPRIKIALQVMCEKTARDLTVADVAHQIGLSPSRFEHILKSTTGRTFRHHIRGMRIRQAKRLLKDWRLSLKQIAYLTGYSSPSSFSRAFRSAVRRSPSQYRLSGAAVQHRSMETEPVSSEPGKQTAGSVKPFFWHLHT